MREGERVGSGLVADIDKGMAGYGWVWFWYGYGFGMGMVWFYLCKSGYGYCFSVVSVSCTQYEDGNYFYCENKFISWCLKRESG